MSTRKIAPGTRSGDLEAVEYVGGQLRCLCHKCGNSYMVRPGRFGQYTACRACRNPNAVQVGHTYGNILVLARTAERYGTEPTYRCRCLLCGREITLRSGAVRKNRSCGCAPPSPEAQQAAGAAGVAATVANGTQLYVATRESPNAGNKTGYRWVRVLKLPNGNDWIFATFRFRGETYYRGGFETKASAYEWALEKHRRLLSEAGITDPRNKNEEESSNGSL